MKVVGYVRVSTEEQAKEGFSLAAQEAKIRAYCVAYDRELVGIYADEGVSAKTIERPALQLALKCLGRTAEGIVVCKLDRLTRRVSDMAHLIEHVFQKHHLMSVADSIDTKTAAGRLMLNLLTSVAQWEREKTVELTKEVIAYKRKQGLVYSSVAPLGYKAVDGKLVQEPAEQATLARVYELHAARRSLRQIARVLTEEGRPTRNGGAWRACTIALLLRRAESPNGPPAGAGEPGQAQAA